jgi:phosphinothricin acetyltransferase
MTLAARDATPDDAPAVARIYNEGIADRVGTFETRERSTDDVRGWFDGAHPIVVVSSPDGEVVAFASTSRYRTRDCYAGIAEFSVYVARAWRGRGAGRVAMTALIAATRAAGYWKLVSRVFPENTASRRLLQTMGFREVGVYQRHARLDGQWRDAIIVERLIPENQVDQAAANHASSMTLPG